MSPEALRALADVGAALSRFARAALDVDASESDRLLPLRDAARAAGTSVGVVREAIRAGDLTAFGRQRDRSVRKSDLDVWIESRRLKPVAGPDDADIERRMRRIDRMERKALGGVRRGAR